MSCTNLPLSSMFNEQTSQLLDKVPLQGTLQPALELVPSPLSLSSIMPLPPEAIYNSSNELYSAIQAHAKQFNYAFVRGKSRSISRRHRKKIVFSCDRCEPPPPEARSKTGAQERRRRASSRATGCLFSINAIQLNETAWKVRHRPNQKFAVHNHPPSSLWSSHPSHRRQDKHTMQKIRQFQMRGQAIKEHKQQEEVIQAHQQEVIRAQEEVPQNLRTPMTPIKQRDMDPLAFTSTTPSELTVASSESQLLSANSPSNLASSQLQSCTRSSTEETDGSPRPVFRVPRGLSLVADIPDDAPLPDSIDMSLFDSPRQSTPTPTSPPLPLPPLRYDRPEMVYLRYKEERACYLATHPHLRPVDYRKHKKLPTYKSQILRDERRRMPPDRREPSGQLISEPAKWTDEEVLAFIDYEQVLEDAEVERQSELIRREGYAILGRPRDIWKRVTGGSTEGYIY